MKTFKDFNKTDLNEVADIKSAKRAAGNSLKIVEEFLSRNVKSLQNIQKNLARREGMDPLSLERSTGKFEGGFRGMKKSVEKMVESFNNIEDAK